MCYSHRNETQVVFCVPICNSEYLSLHKVQEHLIDYSLSSPIPLHVSDSTFISIFLSCPVMIPISAVLLLLESFLFLSFVALLCSASVHPASFHSLWWYFWYFNYIFIPSISTWIFFFDISVLFKVVSIFPCLYHGSCKSLALCPNHSVSDGKCLSSYVL